MRQRLALIVPALALAAAGSLPLTGVLSGSAAGASSSRSNQGTSAAPGQGGGSTGQSGIAGSDHGKKADKDKGEHLDLTCWDRHRPMTQPQPQQQQQAAAAPAAPTPMIECDWHPATRQDFSGYKLVRTSQTPGATTTFAAAGPKAATNPTLTQVFTSTSRSANSFVDTNVSSNVQYTYQLEVLDSHGNVAVRSEPQTVTERAPAPDDPETKVQRLDLDCWVHHSGATAAAAAAAAKASKGNDPTRCDWRIADREDFASFRLTRQAQGSGQAPAVLFLTTNPNQTTFTDTTAVHGTKYTYTLEELDRSGNVIGRSEAAVPHADTTPDNHQWMDGRGAAAR